MSPNAMSDPSITAPDTFATKTQATAWLAKQRTLIGEGKVNPTAVVTTFSEYATIWLAGRDLKVSTRTLYSGQLTKGLMPRWGDVRLADIGPADVRAWHATLKPFHGLPHTGAVLAAASGASVAELMARLGRTTPTMAMKYQHAAADRDRVIAHALSDLASGAKL